MVEITDELVEITAKAVAEDGFGRPWDDFLRVNVEDTDHGDLEEYARAALTVAIPLIEAAVVERCAQIVDARKPLYGIEGQNACAEIASSIRATAIRELAKEEG